MAAGLTGGAIAGTLVGNAPGVGSFSVIIDSPTDPPKCANTIDFGSGGGAGFFLNEPLVYNGPTGSNQGITGLTPGAIYYVALPDPTNPDLIQLTDSPPDPARPSACPQGPQRPSTSRPWPRRP